MLSSPLRGLGCRRRPSGNTSALLSQPPSALLYMLSRRCRRYVSGSWHRRSVSLSRRWRMRTWWWAIARGGVEWVAAQSMSPRSKALRRDVSGGIGEDGIGERYGQVAGVFLLLYLASPLLRRSHILDMDVPLSSRATVPPRPNTRSIQEAKYRPSLLPILQYFFTQQSNLTMCSLRSFRIHVIASKYVPNTEFTDATMSAHFRPVGHPLIASMDDHFLHLPPSFSHMPIHALSLPIQSPSQSRSCLEPLTNPPQAHPSSSYPKASPPSTANPAQPWLLVPQRYMLQWPLITASTSSHLSSTKP